MLKSSSAYTVCKMECLPESLRSGSSSVVNEGIKFP